MADLATNVTGNSELIRAAEQVLSSHGERWTEMRRRVYGVLAQSGKTLPAYTIAERLSQEQARKVPANSVYRILEIFLRANLVSKVESLNAFIVNPHPQSHHDCVFLICRNCGQMIHLDDDRLARQFREMARKAKFLPDHVTFEMQGLCAACRSEPRVARRPQGATQAVSVAGATEGTEH